MDAPEPDLIDADVFRQQIPHDFVDTQRFKGKAPPNQGFAFKLWHLLNWAGDDRTRQNNLGAGWISDHEFFLIKQRYGTIIGIQQNTLNFKLRTCQFIQSRQRHLAYTFWQCKGFSKQSTLQDLETIDNKRNINENSNIITPQALYIPLLEQVRIHTQAADTNRFKSDSIFLWDDIVGNPPIWACPFSKFIDAAAKRFCASNDSSKAREIFAYDAQQTQFSQYLKTYNLNPIETAKKMLTYVITHKNNFCITMPEFCTFLARFGPENCLLDKIHQLLCCSKAFNDWFKPGEQLFEPHKAISGSYSNTFANCFIIKRSQGVTYHVYNHPKRQTNEGFLLDETGKLFMTWHAVFEAFSMSQQGGQFPTYAPYETMGFE